MEHLGLGTAENKRHHLEENGQVDRGERGLETERDAKDREDFIACTNCQHPPACVGPPQQADRSRVPESHVWNTAQPCEKDLRE